MVSCSIDSLNYTVKNVAGVKIEHLEDVLCNCNTTDILLLLLQYPEMVDCLDCSSDTRKTTIRFLPYNDYRYSMRHYCAPKFKSYNHFVMYKVKWLIRKIMTI